MRRPSNDSSIELRDMGRPDESIDHDTVVDSATCVDASSRGINCVTTDRTIVTDPQLVEGSTKTRDFLGWAVGTACFCIALLLLPVTLLTYLNVYSIQHDFAQIRRDKAFLVNEHDGLGGQVSTRFLGLTIASTLAQIVGLTTSFMMSLYAYYPARLWLDPSYPFQSNPTPLQYGLLLKLLSNPSIISLFDAGKYLVRTKRKGWNRLLVDAWLSALFTNGLTFAIAAVAIWLHSVTTVVVVRHTVQALEPFKYGIGQNTCYPYPDAWFIAGLPCLLDWHEPSWKDGISARVPGIAVAANNSDDLQVITLADAHDLAVLVRPYVNESHVFSATSFGARASCQSITQSCDRETLIACDGFNPNQFPPVSALHWDPKDPGTAELIIQSANCAYDVMCDHVNTTEYSDFAFLNSSWPPVNSYNLWMQFIWQSEDNIDWGTVPSGNNAVWSFGSRASVLTNCTLQFYDVTLNYTGGGGGYTLVSEKLTDVGLSDGLAGPTRLGHFSPQLVSNVASRAFVENSTEKFLAFLNQELARQSLGSAAIITNVSLNTLSQNVLIDTNVGRYPLIPVFIFSALLFLYSSLPVVIVWRTGWRDLAGTVRLKEKPVEESVLAVIITQRWLTSPLPLVSASYPPDRSNLALASLSIDTTKFGMFDAQDDSRLNPGLATTPSGGNMFRVRNNRKRNTA